MAFNRFNKSEGLDFLKGLCLQFDNNISRYRQPSYDEADARQDLIEPLFIALRWDVRNEQNLAPDYKEVKYEGRVRVKEEGRETIKNPDYEFRYGLKTFFLVEAKAPHIKIPDAQSAFQLRRYAWSKHLPISILTNFETLCVYDTRPKPNIKDDPRMALIKEIRYTDYTREFDFLWNTISYTAVVTGAFDRFAEETKGKRGMMDVDDAFLAEIENFREVLARNIALRNKLDIYQLNNVVQKTIDRIIFLRVCEDRDIERYENLREIAEGGDGIYARLLRYFDRAQDRYNAGLFNMREDKIAREIKIDDRVLKDIILNLYYPSPYAFSAIPVEILGQVYERFLGKTIRLTPSGQAKVEYKPEVRKAGGIYYTPKYIVDYIVENTVGKQLEGKTPNQVKKIRILDPACGSGSFLLGAYDYLTRWYLSRYTEDAQKHINKEIYRDARGEYHLTIDERKRILMDNIYGVDIDPQAVEVTKLSLHLRVLEGETGETLDGQLALIRQPALPDLEANIRCGNSLIGPDFYKQYDIGLFSDDEIRRINVFDWNDDEAGFGKIMKEGGFDVVMGNPPYGAELSFNERSYLKKKYNIGTLDSAALFSIRAFEFLGSKGRHSFIFPKPFIYASNWYNLRNILIPYLIKIVDCGRVWKEVGLEQIIYVISKENKINTYNVLYREYENIIDVEIIKKEDCIKFGFIISGISNKEIEIGKKVIEVGNFLGNYVFNIRGVGLQKFLSDKTAYYKVLGGKQINRYIIKGIKGYLDKNVFIEDNGFIKENSILVQNIVTRKKIIASLPNNNIIKNYIILDTINQLINKSELSSKFILGIINSKLISWFVYMFIFGKAIMTMHFDGPVTKRIPFPNIDFNNPSDVKMHDEMVRLVERMMDLKKRYHDTTDERLRQQLDHAIKATDEQIDQLVYKLYNLTDEEIRIVEGG